MKPIQMFGVVIAIVGVLLLGFAYHASSAPLDQLSNTFTGRYTNQTMWYFVLGAAATLGGALMVLLGKRT